jgi:hypothetical protein
MNPASVVFAVSLSLIAAPAARAAEWLPTSMPWLTLPAKTLVSLPQVFAIPSKAWDYGAASSATGVFAKTDAAILRLEMTVRTGQVGVSLMTADGSKLISKEKVLTPQSGAAQVYVRIRPSGPAGVIVIRNYDAEGRPGSVALSSVQFVNEASLTTDELAGLVQQGLL